MRYWNKRAARGFTLVEILIVVIILGILAAIVIPQFANASTTARVSNIRTQLQTIRGQIELFASEHNDTAPQLYTGLWTVLLEPTSTADTNTITASGNAWPPYLQNVPVNPIANTSAVTDSPAAGYGWYYTADTSGNFSFYALDTAGHQMTY